MDNSIVNGSLDDEIEIDNSSLSSFSFTGDANILGLKFDRPLPALSNFYNVKPKFIDFMSSNYQLDTLSPAQDMGIISSPSITIDMLGNARDAAPDIGAYERLD
jgi:hypothetical protein